MNQRYQMTLENDPDLKLTISLTNVLIITVCSFFYTKIFTYEQIYQNAAVTTWSNPNNCPVYNGTNGNIVKQWGFDFNLDYSIFNTN